MQRTTTLGCGHVQQLTCEAALRLAAHTLVSAHAKLQSGRAASLLLEAAASTATLQAQQHHTVLFAAQLFCMCELDCKSIATVRIIGIPHSIAKGCRGSQSHTRTGANVHAS